MNNKPSALATEKPKLKKKLPPVKQTLTSIYRWARADPLLIEKDQSVKIPHGHRGKVALPDKVLVWNSKQQISQTKPSNSSIEHKNSFVTTFTRPADISSNTLSRRNTIATCKPKNTMCSDNKHDMTNMHRPTNFYKQASLCSNKPPPTNGAIQKKPSKQTLPAPARSHMPAHFKQILPAPTKPHMQPHSKQTLLAPMKSSKQTLAPPARPRRSLSAQHFNRKKELPKTQPEQNIVKSEITQSMTDIADNNLTVLEEQSISHIKKIVTFKTPESYRRRSICKETPLSEFTQQPQSTPQLAAVSGLPNRLNDWLIKRGHSISSYHHLKWFGQCLPEEDDKENMPVKMQSDNIKQENDFSNNNLVVKDALEDLHKLITGSYPLDQCENWLGAIRLKYRQIEEEPQYWECRAAIEQERGNFSVAVECYKTAIVKGAEVNHVDESLDHLLETFSLLNIDTSAKSANQHVKEARNIFKSSIIQFAVQERSLKLKAADSQDKQYLATPVRRSTRLSRSGYVCTPRIKLCNSLHDLESSIQESLSFQKNVYL